MRNLLLIASLTLREAARRRLVLAAGIVTIALVALTAFGFHSLATMHQRGGATIARHDVLVATSMLEIMMAFMFSFVLALGAAFLGALSLGSEIENGTLLAILPRPLRRIEVIVGKWLGNAVLLALYAAGTSALEFGAIAAVTGYTPPNPVLSVALLVAQALVLLTLTMSLSVRLSAIAAGFVTVVLYGLAWMAGIVGSMADVFHNSGVRDATTLVSLIIPSDGIWRAASFSMEPLIMRAMVSANDVNPLVPKVPPPNLYFVWCAMWLLVVLGVGVRSFQTRDI
ncbi:MAG TPA: ABC transporter permease subunit [Candidatus Aquilonibacter sp.]|nr:ABC transporter permease subunit [Candidatus Aquilonibacter sp.]